MIATAQEESLRLGLFTGLLAAYVYALAPMVALHSLNM